ncbi:MAG: hypothetical protein QGG67_08955 [Gammaproteobacteria bacterium]|jgi:hypothetical protein|nr:hypothetical protein [Gammaproteobacteria bacterium]MDP6096098.1 hypothetical protein [Gammaproteobacteria bacterium]MDP7455613.1 hypothetical protein [Gammaproteobacteria bacterium]HJO12659.1 hypothetical protein [Gammaproteobacteria bacterium]|tara:strand:+ start:750 stop:1115 length:366 start_codon:yes stop_codon:yes gene_type:complete
MRNWIRNLVLISTPVLLAACDIEPTSTGIWEINIDTPSGNQSSVWTISANQSISMAGDTVTIADEVVLEGNRISWSTESPNPDDPSGAALRVNFLGTVNGDNLAGTIYTTLGNFSVTGARQ